jgi:EmrB/QacA subfamily drug resistance transporter
MALIRDRAPSAEQVHARRWWILGVLCLSILIVTGGNTTLNLALPVLSRDLGASESQLQWAVAAYSLVFAGLLFATGAIGDRYGRKGALQFGLVVFFTASFFASQSTEIGQITACRAAMGLGAAFIMPSTLSILVNVFPPHERAKAIAIWATTTGVAGSVGPLIVGWALGHFWFGSAFLVYLPVIAVAFIGGWFLVPTSRDPRKSPIDPLGALLSIIGIGALVYGFIEAPDKGWTAPVTLAAFAVGFGVVTLFVLWELRAAEPMLDMRFFRNPRFSVGSGAMMLVFLAMYGVMLLLTQYFQLVLGFTPLGTSVRMLPIALVILVVTPLTPRFTKVLGANRAVALGMALIALGFLLFTRLGIDSPVWFCWIAMAPLMGGVGMAMSPMTASIMSAVPESRAGVGSAMNDATREVGAALGIAVLGSLAASQYTSALHESLGKLPPGARNAAETSLAGALEVAHRLPARLGDAFATSSQIAFTDGIHFAAAVGIVLSLGAALITYRFLPRSIEPRGPLHSPFDALENAAEFGIGGTLPVFADDPEAPVRSTT